MTITKSGRCVVCSAPCREVCDFLGTADLFNPKEALKLAGSIVDEVKKWRDEPVHCPEHSNAVVTA